MRAISALVPLMPPPRRHAGPAGIAPSALVVLVRRLFLEAVEELNDAPAVYVGSADLDAYFPSLKAENDLALGAEVYGDQPPMAGIWIGNRTTAAAHWDMSNNIAVCASIKNRASPACNPGASSPLSRSALVTVTPATTWAERVRSARSA